MKRMKKLLGLILLVGMIWSFSSCDDDEEVVGVVYFPVIVTHTVENAIDYQTTGLEYITYTASLLVNESLEEPKEVYNYSATASNTWENGWNKASYEYSGLTTTEGIDFESKLTGEYETYYMISDDSVDNEWILSEITIESDFYKISGTTSREGMQYSKVYEDSFESTVILHFENLEVNRITGQIKSGTITFSYEGKSSYGATYESSGEVIYSDYSSVVVIS